MENEQVEQVKWETSDPKRELLSSTGMGYVWVWGC